MTDAWLLPHVTPRDAGILRDLEARVLDVTLGARVWFRLRWGSTVSVGTVYCMASWHDLRRDLSITGGRVRLMRHKVEGARICLTRAECAALRRAAAPYIEAERLADVQRVADSRVRMLESDRLCAEERAVQDAEFRRRDRERLDAMSEHDRGREFDRRRRELDRILGRSSS